MCSHTAEMGGETSDRVLQMVIYSIVNITLVIPQRPRDLKWQPSVPFSQALRYSYLNHVTAVTMYQRPSVHIDPIAAAAKVDSTVVSEVTWRHPTLFWLPVCHTLLRVHHFAHSPSHLSHEPRSVIVRTPEVGNFVWSLGDYGGEQED